MEISWGLCSFAFPVKVQSYEENHCRQFIHSSLSGSPQLLVVPQFPTVSWIPGAYHCIPLPSGRCLEALIAIQLPSCPTCRRAQAQIISQCIWEKLWVLGAVQKHGFSLGGGGCGFHQICYSRCGDALSFIQSISFIRVRVVNLGVGVKGDLSSVRGGNTALANSQQKGEVRN